MNIHEQVLEAAIRVAGPDWRFDVNDVVRVLPHLNVSSVRTHVVSRCCTNAPKNHPHKWGYFRRVSRGRYEVMPAYRSRPKAAARRSERIAALKDTIHVVVTKSDNSYTAECVEIAAVTHAELLDVLFRNVQEMGALHHADVDLSD